MKISVFGAGYVGLVTAVCLAEQGFDILVCDKDLVKIKKLKQGKSVIYEPELHDILKSNLSKGKINFSGYNEEVVEASEVIFICVGTPSDSDGRVDLSQLESVIQTIVSVFNKKPSYKLIVVKSTVPAGTIKMIKEQLDHAVLGTEFTIDVASNPEFLREGSAVQDFLQPDRIIIGVTNHKSKELLNTIYHKFDCPKIYTDPQTAEFIKYASNAFLATKISFINMIADMCEAYEADISTVATGMGYDPRIGDQFLQAGLGYGGSCFPKDLRALYYMGVKYQKDTSLIESTIHINQNRPKVLIDKLRNLLVTLNNKEIAVLGLTFKPETDDVRESPARYVIDLLKKEGAQITAVDPLGIEAFRDCYKETAEGISLTNDIYKAVRQKHAVVLITEWNQFTKEVDWEKVKQLMACPVILDGRNCLEPDRICSYGFQYVAIGRANRTKAEVQQAVFVE